MELIELGRSQVHATRVICGAMAVGSARHDRRRCVETLRAAIDMGSTSIATAPIYDFGASEETVGEAIAGLHDRVQVFTQVGLRWDDPAEHGEILFHSRDRSGRPVAVRKNARPESVRLEVERSLRRLGLDTLDLVVLHPHDPHTPIAETMGALKDLLHEGKLRGVGVSAEFGAAQVLAAERALGSVPLAAVQGRFNLLERRRWQSVLVTAHEHRIGVLACSPFALGLLSRKHSPGTRFGADDLRSAQARFHPENLARVTAALQLGIEPIAMRHGVSLAQVVLAWVLAEPMVTCVVAGASQPDQARANVAAEGLRLSAEELITIDYVFERVQLDPYAGLSLVREWAMRGKRVAGAVKRRVGRVAGGIGMGRGRRTGNGVGTGDGLGSGVGLGLGFGFGLGYGAGIGHGIGHGVRVGPGLERGPGVGAALGPDPLGPGAA